ncbi:DNA transfer protein [Serratia sp. UGAL515B_01]|uniref:DNA transfer protein n=1 Tax=Serratia sp. UGAL515B_01 TaxID=2986763 RepID=UPI002954CC21|nr:DNA transfer protein [Serratia sp. UGAL515B_01]WON77583.1 DNA transfer protein [Serratia sp. UGAL515B_01]
MCHFAFSLARKLAGFEPLYPEKGGKGGDGGAGVQADAINQQTGLQREQWQTVMNGLAPFTPMAQQYVQQLQGLSTLPGQEKALGEYYNSGQFKQMSDMARYQNLAAAEATGGLGSTATSNQLAFIAPQLGENWLNGQMNSAQNLANIGLGALQGQANAGQTYANNTGQLLQQNASLAAQRANQPSRFQQGLTGALGGASAGMAIGGPWGAAIGGGLGALGGLF